MKLEREEEHEPHQVQDGQEEVQKEGVVSLQGEETSEEPGDFGPPEQRDLSFLRERFLKIAMEISLCLCFLFRNIFNFVSGCLIFHEI